MSNPEIGAFLQTGAVADQLSRFAYAASLVTDDLVRMRYLASTRPGVQEAFASMFPAPRQRWVDAMAHREADLRAISAPTLLKWIVNAPPHIFGRCGHWTQIEHTDEFCDLVAGFLAR